MPLRAVAQAAAAVVYDITTQGYAIVVGGRSQTFLPSHIDPTLSTPQATVYLRTAGSTTDSLTLTKPGNAGPFNFRYVAGGYWQRTNLATTSGSFDAFAYGLETADAATPRSGHGDYAVTLLAARADVFGVTAVTGQGSAQVDFSSGLIFARGNIGPSSDLAFFGQGQFSSTTNGFDGAFNVTAPGGSDFWTLRGRWNGRLYGPAGEEIGAAFSGIRDDGMDMMVGTLIGRGGPQTAVNTSLKAMTYGAFLGNDGASMKASIAEGGGPSGPAGSLSATSRGTVPLVINYDPATLLYTVISADGTSFLTANNPPTDTRLRVPFYGNVADDLKYVSATTIQKVSQTSDARAYDRAYIAYGLDTPAAAMPRTGSAGYDVGLTGNVADAEYPGLLAIMGTGVLTADFATGAITADGTVRYPFDTFSPGGLSPTGVFNLAATMSSTANAFSGTIDLTGLGAYSGTLNGRFYGPTAQEVGAAFTASDGAGGVLAGALTGKSDPSILDPLTTLQALTTRTEFVSARKTWGHSNLDGVGTYAAYDPATQTFAFENIPGEGAWYPLGSAQRDATRSNATFTAYSGIGGPAGWGGVPYTGRVFNTGAGNPKLELSYSTFANVRVPALGVSANTYYNFGVLTPQLQMPRSGTAEYAGIVVGSGTVAGDAVSIDGASRLTADFGAATFNTRVNMVTTSDATGVATTLPERIYTGTILSMHLSGAQMRGSFYGPGAREFGAVFVDGDLYGVIAGKKAP